MICFAKSVDVGPINLQRAAKKSKTKTTTKKAKVHFYVLVAILLMT